MDTWIGQMSRWGDLNVQTNVAEGNYFNQCLEANPWKNNISWYIRTLWYSNLLQEVKFDPNNGKENICR